MAVRGFVMMGTPAGAGAGSIGGHRPEHVKAPLPLPLSLVPPESAFSSSKMTKSEKEGRASRVISHARTTPEVLPTLFPLIHSDAFIHHTHFEGGDPIQAAEYLLNILSVSGFVPRELSPDGKVEQFKAKLQQYIHRLREILSTDTPEKRKILAEKIRDEALRLTPGTSLILPIGCARPVGQFLMCEIEKKADEKYTITIINTNEGVQHHTSIFSGYKEKVSPVIIIDDVTPDQLFSGRPPKADRFYALIHHFVNPDSEEYQDKDVYFHFLGDLSLSRPGTPSQAGYSTSQRARTSAWKVLLASLRMHMAPAAYKEIIFNIKLSSLSSFFVASTSKIHEDSVGGEQTRRLLREGAKNVLRLASKLVMRTTSAMAEEKVKDAVALAETILENLDNTERTIELERKAKETKYVLTASALSSVTCPPKTPEAYSYPAQHQSASDPLTFFDRSSLNSPESLLKALHECSGKARIYASLGQPELAKQQIHALLDHIPLPDETDFYSTLSKEDSLPLLEAVFYLFTSYSSICEIDPRRRLISRERVALVVLYGVIHGIALEYETKAGTAAVPPVVNRFVMNFNASLHAEGLQMMFFEGRDFEKFSRVTTYFNQAVRISDSSSLPYLEPFSGGYSFSSIGELTLRDAYGARSEASILEVIQEHVVRFLRNNSDLYKVAQGSIPEPIKKDFDETTSLAVGLFIHNREVWDRIGCPHLRELIFVAQTLKAFESGDVLPRVGASIFFCSVQKGIFSYDRPTIILSHTPPPTRRDDWYHTTSSTPAITPMPWTDYRSAAFAYARTPSIGKIRRSEEEVSLSGRLRVEETALATTSEASVAAALAAPKADTLVADTFHRDMLHALLYESLKPIEMLSRAEAHFEAFADPKLRMAFFEQLFKSVIIDKKSVQPLQEAMKDPLFFEAAIRFIKKGIATFTEDYSADASQIRLFIYSLGIFLLQYTPPESPYFERIVNELSSIRDLLKVESSLPHFHYLHHLHSLLLTFFIGKGRVEEGGRGAGAGAAGGAGASAASGYTKKEMGDLLHSWIYVTLNRPDLEEYLPALKIALQHGYELFSKYQREVAEILTPDFLRLAIKDAVHMDIGSELALVPSGKGPFHYHTGGADKLLTNIDVLKGELRTIHGDVRVGDLSAVKDHPHYKALFGDRSLPIASEGAYWFITDEKGGRYRIRKASDRDRGVPGLEKFMNGEWAQYKTPRDIAVFYEIQLAPKFASTTLPLSLFIEHHHWIGERGLYIVHAKLGEIDYFVQRGDGKIFAVTQDSKGHIALKAQVSIPTEPLCELLSRFESPSFTLLSKQDSINRLVFPRFVSDDGNPLSFEQTTDGWILEDDRSLTLASSYSSALLAPFTSFILLDQRSTGKQFAMIPLIDYCTAATKPLPDLAGGGVLDTEDLNSITDRKNRGLLSRHFTLIPVEEGELAPVNSEQIAYATYIKLGQKHYKGADFYLQKLTYIDVAHPKIQDTLKRIIALVMSSQDSSPQAIALSIRCQYLLAKAAKHQGKEFAISSKNYMSYLSQLGNIEDSYRLSTPEEIFLIESFSPRLRVSDLTEWERIKRREGILKGSVSPLLTAGASSSPTPPLSKVRVSTAFSITSISDCHTLTSIGGAGVPSVDLYTLIEGIWTSETSDRSRFEKLYGLVSQARYNIDFIKDLKLAFERALVLCKDGRGARDRKNLLAYFYLLLISDKPLPLLFGGWLSTPQGSACRAKYDEERRLSRYGMTSPAPEVVWQEYFKTLEPKTGIEGLRMHGIAATAIASERDEAPMHLAKASYPKTAGESPLVITFTKESASTSSSLGLVAFQGYISAQRRLSVPFGAAPFPDFPIDRVSERITAHAPAELVSAIGEECRAFSEGYEKLKTHERSVVDLDQRELRSQLLHCERQISDSEAKLLEQEASILNLANKKPAASKEAASTMALTVAGTYRPLKMNDLVYLFLSKSPSLFRQANPSLTDAEIAELYNSIGMFLYGSIHLQQLRRLHEKGEEVCGALKEDERTSTVLGSRDIPRRSKMIELLLALQNISSQQISYDFSKDPEFLVFEYTASLMFRRDPDQKAVLEHMLLPSSGEVAQVMMGGGKTTVIAANLIAKAALSGKIGVLITPSFQYHSLFEAFRKTMKASFNIDVLTFSFGRDELNERVLDYIYGVLLDCKTGSERGTPKALVLCPEMLHVLLLEFLSLHGQLLTYKGRPPHEIPKDLLAKNETLRKIINLFQKDGYGLGDELQILLDIIKETYIPLGEPQSIPLLHIQFVKSLFLIIETTKFSFTKADTLELGLKVTGDGPFTLTIKEILSLQENRQAYFSTFLFKKFLAPKIAQELAKHPELMLHEEELQRGFIRYATGMMKGKVQVALEMGLDAYVSTHTRAEDVLDEEDRRDFQFVFRLRTALHGSPDPDAKKAADLIAIAKYLCSDILPFTFSKTGNVNFGRSREEKEEGKVVPYICADTPSKGNEFGNPWEAMAYHMMSALIYGVSKSQIEAVFARHHEEATWSAKHKGIPYKETPAAIACKELFGFFPSEYAPNADAIFAAVHADPKRKLAVEEYAVERFVHSNPLKLNTNAVTLPDMMGVFKGFSGTLDVKSLSLPLQRNPLPDVEVNPQCVRALLEKNDRVLVAKAMDPRGFMTENFPKIPAEDSSRLSALLDLGGVFKDFDNTQIAKEILRQLEAQGSPIKAVIFFTRHEGSTTADYPALMTRGSDEIQILADTTAAELAKFGLRPGDYFSYYDKRHCTGTDIKQPADAIGLVTFDSTVPIDDGTQAIMRFRGFLEGQRLHFVIPEYVLPCTLSIHEGASVQELMGDESRNQDVLLSLVTQMMVMQVQQNSKKTVKAFQKMLANAAFKKGKEILLSIESTPANSALLMDHLEVFGHWFFVGNEDRPYENYGSLDHNLDLIESLKLTQAQIMGQLRKALSPDSLRITAPQRAEIVRAVDAEMESIIAHAESLRRSLVATVKQAVSATPSLTTEGGEMERAVQAERQTENMAEKNLILEQEVNAELARYQTPLVTLTPKSYPKTDAAALITSLKEAHLTPAVAAPISARISTDFGVQRYEKLFSSPLYVLPPFATPYTVPLNLFDFKSLPMTHLLLLEVRGGYRGFMVSEEQAFALRSYLTATPQEGAWLVMPNASLQAGDHRIFETIPDAARQIVLEFSILSGNIDLCFERIEDYLDWIDGQERLLQGAGAGAGGGRTSVDLNTLRRRFFYLLSKRYGIDKSRIENYLLQKDRLLYLVDQETKIDARFAAAAGVEGARDLSQVRGEAIKALSPEDIHSLTDKQRYFVRHLERKEQIQAVPLNLVPFLNSSQIPLITPAQVPYVRKGTFIQAIPIETLNSVPGDSLSQDFMNQLSAAQIAALTSPSILARLHPSQLRSVNPDLIPSLPIASAAVFFALTPEQLFKASREQWTRFSGVESDALTAFCRQVTDPRFLDLLPMTTARHFNQEMVKTLPDEDWISHCTGEQLKWLTDAQFSMISRPDLVKRIPYPHFKKCNPQMFTHLSIAQLNRLATAEDIAWFRASPLETITPEVRRGLNSPYLIRELPIGLWVRELNPTLERDKFFFKQFTLDQVVAFLTSGGNTAFIPLIYLDKVAAMNDAHRSLIPHLSAAQIERIPERFRPAPPAPAPAPAPDLAATPRRTMQVGGQQQTVAANPPARPAPVLSRPAAAPNPQEIVRRATYTQLLALHPDKLQYATAMQKIAYGVSMVGLSILGTLFFVPIEITYLLARCCCLHFMDPLHIGIWYVFERFGQMISGAREAPARR